MKKVTEGHASSGRRSRDRMDELCQTQRFLEVSSNSRKFLKFTETPNNKNEMKTTYASVCGAVAQRSRDSGRRSRDRHATVKQRFLDVSSDLEIF